MKRLTLKEFFKQKTENIFVVKKHIEGAITLIYDIEHWETPVDINGNFKNYGDDNFRIEEFFTSRDGTEWNLELAEIKTNGFRETACEVRGVHCGGITFYHEEHRTALINANEELYILILNNLKNEKKFAVNIYECNDKDVPTILEEECAGIYIFVILEANAVSDCEGKATKTNICDTCKCELNLETAIILDNKIEYRFSCPECGLSEKRLDDIPFIKHILSI